MIIILTLVLIAPIVDVQSERISKELTINQVKDVASINIFPEVQYVAPGFDTFFLIRVDRELPDIEIHVSYEILYAPLPSLMEYDLQKKFDVLPLGMNSTYNILSINVTDVIEFGEYDFVLNVTINGQQYFRVLEVFVEPNPWADDDVDNIPNYIDREEFNVTREVFLEEFDGLTWDSELYIIEPSGIGDFEAALSDLGALEPEFEFDNYFVVVIDMINPLGTSYDLLHWLSDYGLYNMSMHMDIFEKLIETPYTPTKTRIRTMYVFAIDNDLPRMMANEYYFVGTSSHAHPINPVMRSPVTFNVKTASKIVGRTASKGVDTLNSAVGKVLSVVELIEEVHDFVNGKLGVWDIIKKIAGKAVGNVIQWIITAILEFLPTAVSQIVGVIKLIMTLAGIKGIKDLLKKLNIGVPWWLDWMDPIGYGHIFLSVSNKMGTLILGYNESDGSLINQSAYGLYFADEKGFWQIALLNRSMCPYYVALIKGSDINATEPPEYNLLIEDPTKKYTIGIWDTIMQDKCVIRVYLENDILKVNRITGYFVIQPPIAEYGSIITIEGYVTDENGTFVSGLHGYVYINGVRINFTETTGKYVAQINTTQFDVATYFIYMTFYDSSLLSLRHYYPIEIIMSKEEIDDLHESIDDLNQQVDDLQQNVTDLQQQVEDLRSEMNKVAQNSIIYGGAGAAIGILLGLLVAIFIKKK